MDITIPRRQSAIRLLVLMLALLIAAIPVSIAPTVAQEASPEPAPSLLAGLGLPVLEVTVSGEGVLAPGEIGAGPVLFTGINETDGLMLVEIVQLPDGVTEDEFLALNDDDSGTLPEWVANAVSAGGVEVTPGASGSIVVNLAPGEWTVIATTEVGVAEPSASLSVTGESISDVSIPADFSVDMGAYAFNFPEMMAAGPQIWHVANSHTVPHHVAVLPVDRAYTAEEVMDGLMAEIGGSPVADGFSFQSSVLGPPHVGPIITGGQEVWMEIDLAPGHYVALCFISDPGSDVPHVMQGMIDTFEVTEG